jgi:hypothetical protein
MDIVLTVCKVAITRSQMREETERDEQRVVRYPTSLAFRSRCCQGDGAVSGARGSCTGKTQGGVGDLVAHSIVGTAVLLNAIPEIVVPQLSCGNGNEAGKLCK